MPGHMVTQIPCYRQEESCMSVFRDPDVLGLWNAIHITVMVSSYHLGE